ncbi:Kinase-like protein [Mycena kentingensis (nom. inval.)]|nr:Kinase-like protein [Mycena kentingensis (nom. inval.)]
MLQRRTTGSRRAARIPRSVSALRTISAMSLSSPWRRRLPSQPNMPRHTPVASSAQQAGWKPQEVIRARERAISNPPPQVRSNTFPPVAFPRMHQDELLSAWPQTLVFLIQIAEQRNNSQILCSLKDIQQKCSNLMVVDMLIAAGMYKDTLTHISSRLMLGSSTQLQAAFDGDEQAVAHVLLNILSSRDQTALAVDSDDDSAQALIDIIHYLLDRKHLNTKEAKGKAQKIMGKLAKRCYRLPQSLFITGVSECSAWPQKGGGYGDVFQAMLNGVPVALKRLRMYAPGPTSGKHRGTLCKEALLWQQLSHDLGHKNILPLLGIDSDSFSPVFCMVSPWMKNGTVNDFLANIRGADRIRTVNTLIYEIAEGLAFLHAQGVMHGDLRGANILVDDERHARLADFGLAALIDVSYTETTSSRMNGGCVRWKAPEAFLSPTPSKPIDIYAFACVCYELYTSHQPFHDIRDIAVYEAANNGRRPTKPTDHSIPGHIWQLMEKCWSQEPAQRPDVQQVLAHLSHLPVSPPVLGHNSQVLSPQSPSWIPPMVTSILEFIDRAVDPSDYFLDLVESRREANGTISATARLSPNNRDHLRLAAHVRQRDMDDLHTNRTTCVAIRIIPLRSTDSQSFEKLRQELDLELHCEHIFSIDGLYLDPRTDNLWIRTEITEMPLSRVIDPPKARCAPAPGHHCCRLCKGYFERTGLSRP